ncbi:MAG: hypothetical protein E7409_07705 [Ruminococcaceae bacterium]|nr:hypothetical protein [Oscillospiraceae bacterium]
MKKRLTSIIICMALVVSLGCVEASAQEERVQCGFAIALNAEPTDETSVIYNQTHYVPMRTVFERMGAYVFYRERDGMVLALSRDGDMIYHMVGDTVVTVNGEQKVFEKSSVLEEGKTYIPIDMVSAALNPDRILYDDRQLNIQKYMFNNNYHKIIKDVLDACGNDDFYPERFQEYIDYHVEMPEYSIEEVVFRVNLGLDEPFYENVATIQDPYALLVLVNKYFRLPENFEQYNLVNMSREYTVNDGKQYLLAGVAYESYVQMADAAKQDGLSMRVISAYRTEAYQTNLYNNKLRTTGKVNAERYSARPGHSEHQTGLAVDICSTNRAFEYTPEFQWLQEHAHEYGYILRYQKGKEWITGYAYEPWHYRYVGTDAAKRIHEEGVTYEEYYAKCVAASEFR